MLAGMLTCVCNVCVDIHTLVHESLHTFIHMYMYVWMHMCT